MSCATSDPADGAAIHGMEPDQPKTLADARLVADDLTAWYRANHWDLPWRRRSADAYATLVAEKMLQQTRVETVIGYYDRFLALFPTAAALARADEGEVLAAWEGLGYYRRARQLQAAAKMMADEWAGKPPRSVKDLRKLPGVGAYVAGAIGAISFGWPAAAVDGNVLRVVARLDDLALPVDRPAGKKHIEARAEALSKAADSPGDLVQALMDLGRTVCKPQHPACERCPVAAHCRAYAAHRQAERPVRDKGRTVPQAENWLAGVVVDGRRRLLAAPRGPGLLAGLWGLPMVQDQGEQSVQALRQEVARWGVATSGKAQSLGELTHGYTHRTWHVRVFALAGEGQSANPNGRFLSEDELHTVAFGRAFRRVLDLWQKSSAPSVVSSIAAAALRPTEESSSLE